MSQSQSTSLNFDRLSDKWTASASTQMTQPATQVQGNEPSCSLHLYMPSDQTSADTSEDPCSPFEEGGMSQVD